MSRLQDILANLVRDYDIQFSASRLVSDNAGISSRKEQIKALFLELLVTPPGHVPDEQCCDTCDLLAELRDKINKL